MSESDAMERAEGLPETMTAVGIEHYGKRDRLEVMEMPVPVPAPGEVLVRVHGAGVGIWDVGVRRGEWDMERPLPLVLGLEASGVVFRTGSEDSAFHEGDAVIAYLYPLPYQGAYAEYVLLPERYLAAAPKGLDLVEAAALPVAGTTAHLVLTDILQLQPGETLLVTAAAGGVGTLAVQMARELGAHVVATAGSESSRDYLGELGVEEIVDYRHEDWPDRVRAAHPEGVDAVLDAAGGKTGERALEALRDGGRLAELTADAPSNPPRGIRVLTVAAVADAERLALVSRMVEEGRLQVRVQRVLPLREAAHAHEVVEKGHVHGKVILDAAPKRAA
ncbi:MAG TPA: NADP-dependent oxidoreductase [Longimicrobiales bacterium]|nr:NADP-dependent oxidoreductase [Longimicrobiales bacterium]